MERGGGAEQGGVEGRETMFGKYCMGEESISKQKNSHTHTHTRILIVMAEHLPILPQPLTISDTLNYMASAGLCSGFGIHKL